MSSKKIKIPKLGRVPEEPIDIPDTSSVVIPDAEVPEPLLKIDIPEPPKSITWQQLIDRINNK